MWIVRILTFKPRDIGVRCSKLPSIVPNNAYTKIAAFVACYCLALSSAHAAENESKASILPSPRAALNQQDIDYNVYPMDENSVKAAGGIIIQGDRLDIYLDRTYSVLGNGVVEQESQTIRGDRIEYNTETKNIDSVGHAEIKTADFAAKGSSLHMNLENSVGEMKNVVYTIFKSLTSIIPGTVTGNTAALAQNQTIKPGTLPAQVNTTGNAYARYINGKWVVPQTNTETRGTADSLFFEGEGQKRLVNSSFTSCKVGVDDWFIKASEIKLNDNAREATSQNTTIEFKGVPIMYTPYMSFPYGNERKSGFLSPTYGMTSKSGLAINIPYYFNIAPNRDATITPTLLSKRGLQLQGEFRYLDASYNGTTTLEYLPTDAMTDKTRYSISTQHSQLLGAGWWYNWNYQRVSDNKYFSELGSRIVLTSAVNLPQNFNFGYTSPEVQFNVLTQRYQNLLTDKATYPYQLAPSTNLNVDKLYGPVNLTFLGKYDRFDVDSGVTGKATGERFVANPAISIPLRTSYAYITPKFGVNYTSYNINGNQSEYSSGTIQRTLPIFSLDSGLNFDRDTKLAGSSYAQTLEPRIFYTYIPYKNQFNNPIFDTAQADINMTTLFKENQFVGYDRINNANQVTLAITSRLIDADAGLERVSFTAAQRFYFEKQKVGLLSTDKLRSDNTSDYIFAVNAKLKNSISAYSGWQINSSNGKTNKFDISARYQPEAGRTLNLSYRYTAPDYARPINQYNLSTQWPITSQWYAVGNWNYSIQDSKIIQAIGGLEYNAGCWQSRFVVQRVATATANAAYALYYQLELGDMTSIGSSAFDLLTRTIPGYTPNNFIPMTSP